MSKETIYNPVNIGIDGGAGGGKGTLARPLSQVLGCNLVDGGAMYRALAKHLHDRGYGPEEAHNHLDIIEEFGYDGKLVSINGARIEDELLRTSFVDKLVPEYGKNVRFKSFVISKQIELTSKKKGWVAEGRNMALSVMEKTGDLSFYLLAHPETRAARRWLQRKQPIWELKDVIEEIKGRDAKDYNHSPPLIRPEYAAMNYDHVIDTEKTTISQNFEKILECVVTELDVKLDRGILSRVRKELREKDEENQWYLRQK